MNEPASDGVTPVISEIEQLMRTVNRRLRQLTQRLVAERGISYAAFHCLAIAHKHPGAPIGEIAERVGVTSGTMTSVLDSLEGRGLLSRRRAEHDRRVIQIEVTEQGRALIDDVVSERQKALAAAMADLGAEALEALQRAFRHLEARLCDPANPATHPDGRAGGPPNT
ncbi:MAG TPA: MarR family transcriptional regulator [Limnochordia bacterium]|nr:MarR family transcriptional regulator [Limnochordia bacterium]